MVLNRQRKIRLSTRPLAAFLQKIQRELKLENVEVSIAFVSDAEIARWNESYRHKKGPTDVLSFPAVVQKAGHKRAGVQRMRGTSAGIAEKFLGDVAIAPEAARRYAKKNGRTWQSELRILMLHGVLHLVGYDHESDNGQMNRIEQRLRRRLGIA
jgi:probable rRNA maturation factor